METQLGAPHLYAMPPPPQLCGLWQVPQSMVPPQPLGMVPQVAPIAPQLVGVQLPPPHTPGVPPPPQVWPVPHGLQYGVTPPHPSLCGPHLPG